MENVPELIWRNGNNAAKRLIWNILKLNYLTFLEVYGFERSNKLKCANCGKKFEADTPFIIKGYVGIEMQSQKHGCPEKFSASHLIPTGKELEVWSDIINFLKEE